MPPGFGPGVIRGGIRLVPPGGFNPQLLPAPPGGLGGAIVLPPVRINRNLDVIEEAVPQKIPMPKNK
jgi:hypothetical protein